MPSDETDMTAIIASPLRSEFSPIQRTVIAAMVVIIRIIGKLLVNCRIAAIAIARNATCERPSPIKENLFNTSVTPSSDEQRATSTPTIRAYCTKEYEKYNFKVSIIVIYLIKH